MTGILGREDKSKSPAIVIDFDLLGSKRVCGCRKRMYICSVGVGGGAVVMVVGAGGWESWSGGEMGGW